MDKCVVKSCDGYEEKEQTNCIEYADINKCDKYQRLTTDDNGMREVDYMSKLELHQYIERLRKTIDSLELEVASMEQNVKLKQKNVELKGLLKTIQAHAMEEDWEIYDEDGNPFYVTDVINDKLKE